MICTTNLSTSLLSGLFEYFVENFFIYIIILDIFKYSSLIEISEFVPTLVISPEIIIFKHLNI